MSGGIQLSSEMISEIKLVVSRHDPEADNDMVFMQYLTAISGYVLAHQEHAGLDKKEILKDLAHFMGQVVEQVERDSQPAEEAFGIWKPDQH